MRRAWVGIAAVSLAVGLTACTTEPAPSPTPTGFADEDAAFAAAEATYRAYVDALNRVDLSDPETFEDVYRWTTGDALAAIKKSLTTMHASGWIVSGESRISLVEPIALESNIVDVALAICLDVSGVTVHDSSGESVVSQDRVDVQSMTARVLPDSDAGAIRSIEPRDGDPSC